MKYRHEKAHDQKMMLEKASTSCCVISRVACIPSMRVLMEYSSRRLTITAVHSGSLRSALPRV
jgi:hypothetical protein